MRAARGEGNVGSMAFGYLPVKVSGSGEDVTGLRLKVPPGPVARGRILFDGDAPPPKRVIVSPSPINFASAPVGGGPPNTVTREDWTFEVTNMSGVRMVRAIASPAVWTLKQVTLNGRDITDEPIDFRNGDVNGIEITLTSRGPVLNGSVTDDGKPSPMPVSSCPLKIRSGGRFRRATSDRPPERAGRFHDSRTPAR